MYMVVLLLGIAYGWWLREYVFPMRKRFSSKHEETAGDSFPLETPESENRVKPLDSHSALRQREKTISDRKPLDPIAKIVRRFSLKGFAKWRFGRKRKDEAEN